MISKKQIVLASVIAIVLGIALNMALPSKKKADGSAASPSAANLQKTTAALTVTTVRPVQDHWPRTYVASGAIFPWQEAVISSEISGLRISQLLVDVGSRVKRGQVLVILNANTIKAEIRKQQAMVAQARAALSEAKMNADRARSVKDSGVLSAQQVNQYLVAHEAALANFNAAQAQLDSEQIKLSHTQIQAIDDGIISSRTATLGAVVATGSELFRLVRQERLEWQAELSPNDLGTIKAGQKAHLTLPDKTRITGTIRLIAPTFNTNTRNALAYVSLPSVSTAHAGMYAKGEIEIGNAPALTLPQASVILRDGKSYVFEVSRDHRVIQRAVTVGRRSGNRVEITQGITLNTPVVAAGGAFLNDGDPIRQVPASATAPSLSPASASASAPATPNATPTAPVAPASRATETPVRAKS